MGTFALKCLLMLVMFAASGRSSDSAKAHRSDTERQNAGAVAAR